jgi:glycosyltransferase involved in cell wall biosynthesis
MRIVALLATYNEERFIRACIEHHVAQGLEVFLIDNESTDRTLEWAREFEGRGLAGVETLPRDGVFRWANILRRKEELAKTMGADWYLHLDADEFFIPPPRFASVRAAIEAADAAGCTACNAKEYVFVPTRESPDHDGPGFRDTMRSYYPFEPRDPHRLCTWKQPAGGVDLAGSGGHRVAFPGLRRSPWDLGMKHYLFLSPGHAADKYGRRKYDEAEVQGGWHRWRADFMQRQLRLPSAADLRAWTRDDALDASNPLKRHIID